MPFKCKNCGRICEKAWYDNSLGGVEAYGTVIHENNGVWVSECCEEELEELSEDNPEWEEYPY